MAEENQEETNAAATSETAASGNGATSDRRAKRAQKVGALFQTK